MYLYHVFPHSRLILALHPYHSPHTREIKRIAYILHPISSSSNGMCTSLLAYQWCGILKSCGNAHRRDAFNEIQRTSCVMLILASRQCDFLLKISGSRSNILEKSASFLSSLPPLFISLHPKARQINTYSDEKRLLRNIERVAFITGTMANSWRKFTEWQNGARSFRAFSN